MNGSRSVVMTPELTRIEPELAGKLDALGLPPKARLIALLLIETGRVTAVECQAEDCLLPSRRFRPASSRTERESLQVFGSTPDAAQLLHAACRQSRTRTRSRDVQKTRGGFVVGDRAVVTRGAHKRQVGDVVHFPSRTPNMITLRFTKVRAPIPVDWLEKM